ncbi:hypothetical protein [Amycolatopsis sp. CA-230715]|uniref:hypothetical protein n=1 Tax=Amycolatopsis sp. CA-230715 TaxID=2745196 RepID=UPI001C034ECF|nr:hypothetical protein [Amycolatopsis sp. CA-230715]
MSRAELAEAANAWLVEHAARHGVLDEHYVARLERGKIRWPNADYRAAISAVLGQDDSRLGFRPSATHRRPIRPLTPERETVGQGTPGKFHRDSPNSVTAPADVVAIQAMCAGFQTADRQVGGGALYRTVVRYLNAEVAPKLLDPHKRSGAALFAAACSVTEIAGWMAHDSGDDTTARSHFDSAYRLAVAAGNEALTGNVCASMSHLAGQLGVPADAVRIAEIGLTRAKRAPGTTALLSRLHAMRARGLAIGGDSRACVTALEKAEQALGRVGDERAAEWIAGFDAGSLASETALCLRRLGDLSEARRQAELVITLRQGDRVRSRAFGQLTLARVLADAGEPGEAAAMGIAVCEVLPALSSTRVRSRLDRLGEVLQHNNSVPEVANFLDRLAVDDNQQESSAWPV